ncbi:MAG TPA: UbiD family decarboxylase domain-containing protein, partial [Candidatus Angelobacter sp.]|nr:UbiD family decarboxylase domain-containing protein [Candidatus Angelobacter sp.]
MAYSDLREWIAALDSAGELQRIRTEVDPVLEIAEITDRVSKGAAKKYSRPGGPALLFENVKGANGIPVLINQFGSERRMQMAMGVDRLDETAERIRQLLNVKSPEGFFEKLKMLPMLADMGKFFPKTVATGPCKEVIKKKDFSLLDFPILQCWPQDAGRFITLPCVITRDPKTGKRNVGMYRMQIYDATTAGMHWQRQKVAAEHYRERLRGAQAPSPADENAKKRAGVDIMARSGGGSVLAEGTRPSGTMEVAVAI